jgi:ATP-dependent DNA helicase RecG
MQLESDLQAIFPRLSPAQKKALKKLGLLTVRDLLYYFPVRYGDIAEIKFISSLKDGDEATLYGKIEKLKTGKTFKNKTPMSSATLADDTGSLSIIWFHQPYMAKMLREDGFVKVRGKVSLKNESLSMVNPEIEHIGKLPIGVGDSLFGNTDSTYAYPIYRESKGLTSRWILHAVQKIFSSGLLETVEDPIPKSILETYNLPAFKSAVVWVHMPKKENDAISARKRFAFEEVFFIQLEKQIERQLHEENPSFRIEKSEKEVNEFVKRFPFEATLAQKKAIKAILEDMRKGHAMSRLLEGDVGSGKTAVAATTAYATVSTPPLGREYGHLQVAYMAPTEILAEQHFESFINYFAYLGIHIGLITGSGCKKFPSKIQPTKATPISRSQLLKWVADGQITILIGTHALIQKKVIFKNLACAIIDEQHRFGTKQRMGLRKKNDFLPHLLSMTATPIPRTLALTIYGDLDITLLDELPKGRKPIVTELVLPSKREAVYEQVKTELNAGRQAYVICPRIFEPDPDKESAMLAKSVEGETERLQKYVFPNYRIGMIHGKMNAKQKDEVMTRFKDHELDILVATSVIEVGVNVPNATVILIEGAERFGLSQLHQLRGRVMRSSHQPYCFVFTESSNEKTIDRLTALKTAKNGFELAEKDLQQRGAGDLAGRKQWGVSDLAMEAMKNLKMVEAAREEAKKIVLADKTLSEFPLLQKRIDERNSPIHFE